MRIAPLLRFTTAAIAFAALASCVPPSPPEAAAPVRVPVPTPTPRPHPIPSPTPMPTQADWRDWPMTPGNWGYRKDERGSIALFGRPGADAELTLRCDRQRGQIYLSRKGDPLATGPVSATLRTTSTMRRLSFEPTGAQGYVATQLATSDPILDAIGYSRGRFVIEGGGSTLVVPPWAEILRVVEDCR